MHFTEVIDLYHENLLNEPYHKHFNGIFKNLQNSCFAEVWWKIRLSVARLV